MILNPLTLWKKYLSKKSWFTLRLATVENGQAEVVMDWNKPFIDELIKLGFSGGTDQDIVRKYLDVVTAMSNPDNPMSDFQDDPIGESDEWENI